MAQLLTKQYVREDGIIDTPVQRIVAIKQAYYNYRNKRMEYKPVLQVVKQYETILQEIGDNVPAGMPDLANDFVQAVGAWHEPIIDVAVREHAVNDSALPQLETM